MSPARLILLISIAAAACAPSRRVEPVPSPNALPPQTVVPTFRGGGADVIAPNAVTAPARHDSVAPSSQRNAPIRDDVRDRTSGVASPPDTTRTASDSEVIESAPAGPLLSLDSYANLASVTRYVNLFSGDARTRIGDRLSAGTRYDAMIRQRLRASGIPEEFTYLALIESGYDPDSYSSVAAVGMWQFMAGTARGAGLRVDWWIDERRDPVRETDAAVRFLVELRDQFGSMYLAAAAYNGGPGRISRGLTRLAQRVEDAEPDDKFFTLASSNVLRGETQNYVPQLIAAALIMRDPVAYGISIDTQPAFVYDSVSVPAMTGLRAVARACASTDSVIGSMNGQVLRGMTPPDGPAVWVKVPRGCGTQFGGAFTALDDTVRRGAEWHIAKKGETPTSIAKKSGITLKALRTYNPKLKTAANDLLSSGTKVLIPDGATVKASRSVPDPSIERYGSAVGGSYVVRSGDTLGKIAARNNTTVAAIKRANGLRSDAIVVGQKLRVPR